MGGWKPQKLRPSHVVMTLSPRTASTNMTVRPYRAKHPQVSRAMFSGRMSLARRKLSRRGQTVPERVQKGNPNPKHWFTGRVGGKKEKTCESDYSTRYTCLRSSSSRYQPQAIAIIVGTFYSSEDLVHNVVCRQRVLKRRSHGSYPACARCGLQYVFSAASVC